METDVTSSEFHPAFDAADGHRPLARSSALAGKEVIIRENNLKNPSKPMIFQMSFWKKYCKLVTRMRKSGKMKKLILFLVSVISMGAYAQNIDNISKQLGNVTSGKYEYRQSMESVQPGVVRVLIERIDNKGRKRTEQYVFNLADIDSFKLKPSVKRDVIVVNLTTSKKQKLIKKMVNGNEVSYIYHFVLYASDMDRGRSLAKAIKDAIPVAKKELKKRLSFTGYRDRMDWLQKHIGKVNLPDKQINQEWHTAHYPGSIIFRKNIRSGKTEKDLTYAFNLAFLDPKYVRFFVSGNTFGLKIQTDNFDKLIKVSENGKPKDYVSSFTILTNDVEQARDMKKILKEIIPLAAEKFDASIPRINNFSVGKEKLNQLIATVQAGDKAYNQKLEGNCVAGLTQQIEGKNAYTDRFDFNFIDLSHYKFTTKSRGNVLFLEIRTKGLSNFIKQSRNGEVKAYTSKLKIAMPSAEEASIAEALFKKMIRFCREKHKAETKKISGKSQAFSLLKNNVRNFDLNDIHYEQEVEWDAGNKHLKYKRIVSSGKSTNEYLYEVNIADLNPNSIRIKIAGKKPVVEIRTTYEKAIKFIKDGKVQPYRNKMTFYAPDLETARRIKESLRILVSK